MQKNTYFFPWKILPINGENLKKTLKIITTLTVFDTMINNKISKIKTNLTMKF
jgi:hypothetical protein